MPDRDDLPLLGDPKPRWGWAPAQFVERELARLFADRTAGGTAGGGERPDCKVFMTFGVSCLMLLLMQFSQLPDYVPHMGMEGTFFLCFCYFAKHLAFMFMGPALTVKLAFQESLAEHGLNFKALEGHLLPNGRGPPMFLVYVGLSALAFGVLYLAAGLDELRHTYPFYHSPTCWRLLLLWELLFGLSMIFGEFFFRGFLIHGLKHKYGHGAVWVSTMAYFMIHMTKPQSEALASFAFGIALSVLSLRTGSIAGGAWLHVSIACSIDIACLMRSDTLKGLPW